ncbi:hypothetical protein PoB_007212000 [Plakobranchus ocellatus]|uniref:Uncharacterized protein n=1 Tax=Plakobranchus ocellatus TaxID=259542 RepID=A0AAV4DNJ4_9GAST|nr:hypothetical protein PoB_007212000 [Plakobranchus ocellatus]
MSHRLLTDISQRTVRRGGGNRQGLRMEDDGDGKLGRVGRERGRGEEGLSTSEWKSFLKRVYNSMEGHFHVDMWMAWVTLSHVRHFGGGRGPDK